MEVFFTDNSGVLSLFVFKDFAGDSVWDNFNGDETLSCFFIVELFGFSGVTTLVDFSGVLTFGNDVFVF